MNRIWPLGLAAFWIAALMVTQGHASRVLEAEMAFALGLSVLLVWTPGPRPQVPSDLTKP